MTDESSDDSQPLPVDPGSPPVNVPAFTCVVYVACVDGGVRARVANLAGIEFQAGSERDALAKIVPAFKQRVAELMGSGGEIPWVDPPMEKEAGEQERFLPVHL